MRPRIVLVTDPVFGDDGIVRCGEAVARALPEGALAVQLRDKQRPLVSLRVFASRLRLVTRAAGAALVVNGDARLARDVGADGVHLGRGAGTVQDARAVSGAGAWVSVSAHSDADVRRAIADGADAVLVSPVFPSRPPSLHAAAKEGRGLEALRSARALARANAPIGSDGAGAGAESRIAVYALGGVDADNARACAHAGADGVAVVRALLATSDPGRMGRALHDALSGRW